LHKNAFGGRAPLGPAGGAIALSEPSRRYKGEGRKSKGRKRLGIVRRGRKEGEEKDVKG